jgi:mannose-1-phosphate guanylyltransferase
VGLNASVDLEATDLTPPVWIGGSTRIGRGARIVGPVAIGSGCVIEDGAHVERGVVWDYTRVSRYAELVDKVVCGRYCVGHDGATVALDEADLGWVIDDARIRLVGRRLDPAFEGLYSEQPAEGPMSS